MQKKYFLNYRLLLFCWIELLLVLGPALLPAQLRSSSQLQTVIGIEASILYNKHSSSQNFFPTVSSCGSFSGGEGIGPGVALFGKKQLSDRLSAGISLGYQNLSASMTDKALDGSREYYQGKLVAVDRVHDLTSSVHAIAFTVEGIWKSPLLVDFSLGANIAYAVKQTYTHSERIVSDGDLVFASTGTKNQTLSEGTISSRAPILVSPVIRASYDIALDRSMILTPSVSSMVPLTALRSDVGWRIASYSVGMNVGWKLSSEPEGAVPIEAPAKAPEPVRPSVASVGIDMKGVSDNDEVVPVATISIHTTDVREYVPVVAAVFFDEGVSEIPERYHKLEVRADITSYTSETIPDGLVASHDVLNIIGKRLQDNPSSIITLEGCAGTAEAANTSLASSRAENIKSYLHSVWNIPTNRIKPRMLGLPAKPSSEETADGREENRRVDILSSDFSIVEPISTLGRTSIVNPPRIQVLPLIPEGIHLKDWQITIRSKEKTLTEFTGADRASTLTKRTWVIGKDFVDGRSDSLFVTLTVHDLAGREYSVDNNLSVERTVRPTEKYKSEREVDAEVERYSIITFDFDKAELQPFEVKKLEAIAARVTNDATIRVEGYTDRSGAAQYNYKLSNDRALAVAKRLRQLVNDRGVKNVNVIAKGYGPKEVFSNDVPEGRFLSRTVKVEIVKKLQQ